MKFRAATMNDAELLLEWRNSVDSCKQSAAVGTIETAEHYKWLATELDQGRAPLIIVVDGVDSGYVRRSAYGFVSWFVDTSVRGKGVATEAVAAFLASFDEPSRALVRESNGASIRVAEKVGMRVLTTNGGFITFITEEQ